MKNMQYTGKKPIISHTGISFEGKDDKFNLVQPSIHLLDMLLNFNDQKLNKTIDHKKVLPKDEFFNILHKASPSFESFFEKSILNYQTKLHDEKESVQTIKSLNGIEKEIFQSNLDFVNNYRIQRRKNKIIYEEIIKKSIQIIREKDIKEVKISFSKPLFHIMKSLQGSLNQSKNTYGSNLKVNTTQEKLYIVLTVN